MANQTNNSGYKLLSVRTGKIYEDTGWLLDPIKEEFPTLLRTVYEKKQIEVKSERYGLYRYADWLPVTRILKGSSAPVTYKSTGFARELGLSDLWITFNGYWPEKKVAMKTCSFKETEAYSVCARLMEDTERVLVVASAGNTSRAFAEVCSDNKIPLLICVPEDNLDALWFDHELDDCVKLVCSRSGSDYFDAIHLSNLASCHGNFIAEGGAKNIARRDGMGTTVLSAVTTIGKIPEYYFQAIGSGTGAIAAWEANLRLIEDGRFGSNKMKLLVSQNHPFTPIYDTWKAGSRFMDPMDGKLARALIDMIAAKVLSNRKPPYSVTGGLFDALKDTGGDVLSVTNDEVIAASKLFEDTEGIDIHPAAAVAAATLMDAVKNKNLRKNSLIMLNITGGGEKRFKADKELYYLKPSIVFDINPDKREVREKISSLFPAEISI